MEVKEAIKIAQTIVNNHNAMTGLINCDVEAIQTLIDHATHPQREALDKEKVARFTYTMEELAKAICQTFALPSIDEIIKAFPGERISDRCKCDKALLSWDEHNYKLVCHRCQKEFSEYDDARADFIAALKERFK